MTGKQIRRRDVLRGTAGFGAALLISKLTGCTAAETPSTEAASTPQADSTATGEPVKIGLVAALTGPSALSGEAITRGLTIAIEEVNRNGGVMGGRPLELVSRDDESTPAKGVAATRELIEQEQVAVIFGGLDSPVSLAILPVVHELQTPYMGVWAAATGITRNDFDPNYAFRVSANDNIVDRFLVKHVKENYEAVSKIGLLLINNPWGESNQTGFEEWAPEYDLEIVGIEKFNDAETDISPQLSRLQEAGAEALLLVANAAPAAQAMKSLARLSWEVPVVSHWGVSGGRFPELAGQEAADKVVFVQTYSFYGEQSAKGEQVLTSLKENFNLSGPSEILAPVGTANAYDALHLTALALETAASTEGPKLREAFFNLPTYEGLIKTYEQPFTSDNHDALNENDYILVKWQDNEIVPVES
ncbi:ABC transporter substrate-binding protein [Almyronema epifaneia]|uniref:ABC transporter substrate-binding protein n=1 Tax=Almyronema epifaneia S1 TaxID=2991925 RepID=A0ABW6IAG6_9CYAN